MISPALYFCIDQARQLGLDVIALDYLRPDIAMHTVKLSVPGLCHIWPQLACRRLYGVPVALGWRKIAASVAQLNPQGLFV